MASLVCLPLPKLSIVRASSSSSSSLSPSATSPLPADSLNDKFGRKGIHFHQSNGIPTVDLTVRNGSSLRLHISDAHIPSYKPKVYWKDDGFEEVLFTTPAANGGKGGIGLVINDASNSASKPSLLPTSDWTVKDVDSDAIDALQVELSCSSKQMEITYIVTLYSESMATAVIVKNTGPKLLSLNSAILSHFKFKRRDGAAIQGLEGCSYCSLPPLSSPFEILSPTEAMKAEDPDWFSFSSEPQEKVGSWSLQDVPFTILKNKFSRVYAAPPAERSKPVYHTTPSKYETLDQGRELFFRVIRMGFEDIYVQSPGSLSDKFGKDYFICTGPASMLVPVTVEPGEQWRGAQVIEHDNL
ncbi:photosynthetic NDH subunit of subcomplex B 2, chloroplastic [Cucurbita pepo subsp. pepo]|uniref:photosynthetic NDH subunit of subcomplex B 2, chloroplastic n=1 Tax=Cucurbita pepo subsp. pepo TaxID=3664 RepID=UPI000C9D6E60|nr:photosynthetic NDH subunit of subcomplex B 2, chloroplastic [Cucurbita pepo subsp. pepo]